MRQSRQRSGRLYLAALRTWVYGKYNRAAISAFEDGFSGQRSAGVVPPRLTPEMRRFFAWDRLIARILRGNRS